MRLNNSRRRASVLERAGTLGISLALGAWLAISNASAQTTDEATANAQAITSAGTLQTIVVTAEKRQSTVGTTPISMTALSGTELQDQGISSLEGLLGEVPGMSEKSYGPGQTEFEMRGMTSGGGESPTVGFYLDEISISPPATAQNGKVAIDPDLYDLSRVEVLRGPQGTLYGSGSMGGTIKLVTNQPDLDHFSSSVQGSFSGTQSGGLNGGGNGMLNLPVIPGTFAFRFVATDTWTSGWIDRIVLNDFPLPTSPCTGWYGCTRGAVRAAPVAADYKDVNWDHTTGGRVEALLKPSSKLSISVEGLYQKISMGGPDFEDFPPGTEAHYQPFNVPEPFSDRFDLASATVNYDFDWATLTSATGYWSRQQIQTADGSEILQNVGDVPAYSASGDLGFGAAGLTETDTTSQFSQEVRLTSNQQHPYRWLVGGFFSNYNSTTDGSFIVPGLATILGGIFGTTDFLTVHRPSRILQSAGFGEGSYDITDKLTATIGLRYFSYNATIQTIESGFVTPTHGPTPTTFSGVGSDSGANPKFNLSYQLDNKTLLYSTVAKGFRPGGGNAPIPTTGPGSCGADLAALGLSASPLQYQPDSLWSYEAGEKSSLGNNKVNVNSAVYYEDWSHVQQNVVLGCGYHFFANAGKAAVYGAETEIAVQLLNGLTVTESASYTHAALSEAVPSIGAPDGQPLVDVPNWLESTAINYAHPVSLNLSFVARFSEDYVGPSYDEAYGFDHLSGYDIMHVRAGIAGGVWVAELFVDNLGNEHAMLADTNSYVVNIPDLDRVATNQPRTVGVDFTYRF
jgi:iron complex outermembrane recepter protein